MLQKSGTQIGIGSKYKGPKVHFCQERIKHHCIAKECTIEMLGNFESSLNKGSLITLETWHAEHLS